MPLRSTGSVTSGQILDDSIVNADVNSAAAIAVSKLATITASKAVVTDSNGFLSNAATTATELGYVAGVTSAIQTQLNAKASSPTWTDYTPTVTLVGGVGNQVPVYTTNIGRYLQIGKVVYVSIYLVGDGGNEGAGTGQVNLALPVVPGASQPTGPFSVGSGRDGAFPGTANFHTLGQITAASSVMPLYIFSAATTTAALTGADQATSNRAIRLNFFYEVD